jgi:hypothetical protein
MPGKWFAGKIHPRALIPRRGSKSGCHQISAYPLLVGYKLVHRASWVLI